MVKAICINDKNRPNEIPVEKWVVEDHQYTIDHVFFHPMQGIQGVTIREITLDESCYPYTTFKLSRFGIRKDDLQEFIELAKLCTDLNEVTIEKLIEEEVGIL